MADVTFCPFKEKRYFVFLVIKWFVLPFNGRNLFDSTLLKRKPAVDTIQNYSRFGCLIAFRIVKDSLNLDWWKLRADRESFNIGINGLLALPSSGVDELVPD